MVSPNSIPLLAADFEALYMQRDETRDFIADAKKKERSMSNLPSKLSDEVTKSRTFEPTPHMIVWLDCAVELASDNKSEIETNCNVSRKSWYDWLKVPGFEDWYHLEYARK